jgi:hypothetical protein
MELKEIRLTEEAEKYPDVPEDVNRIVSVLEENGYYCSYKMAREMWLAHSYDNHVDWLPPSPNDEQLMDTLAYYFEVVDG